MNNNLTFIAIVLDRSQSMGSVREETIAGFNAFIDEQRVVRGDALVTLVQFNDRVETVADGVPLSDLPPLTAESYRPHGWTALYDGIGQTIDSVGRKLAALPESERPGKVLVMVQTDGNENRSRHYGRNQIAYMIKHQRDKYSWDFAFIGASESSVADAIELGVPQNFTTKYAADAAGTAQVLRTASAGVANYRSVNRDVYAALDCNFFNPAPPTSSDP